MPGMMDTILNLGLNDVTVGALAKASDNERFAWDCYRRFVQMYGDVVMGVQKAAGEDHEPFETVIEEMKAELFPGEEHVLDTRLDAEALKTLVARFKKPHQGPDGQGVPGGSVEAVAGRGRGGVRFLDERPGDRLPAQVRHSARMGDGRERSGDGVRQHGRDLRFGRGLHALTRRTVTRCSTVNSS